MIDQHVQLFGNPVEVLCRCRYDWPDVDVESHCRILVGYESGVRAFVETSGRMYTGRPRWLVKGTEGTLVKTGLDPQEPAMNRGEIHAVREDPADRARLFRATAAGIEETILPTVRGDWVGMFGNFAAAVRGEEPIFVTPESVLPQLAILEAAERSDRAGELVKLDPGDYERTS